MVRPPRPRAQREQERGGQRGPPGSRPRPPGVGPAFVAPASSAWPKSAAVGNRSPGVGASAFRMAASTAGGTGPRAGLSAGRSAMMCLASTVWGVVPVNGGIPDSISYTTTARAYWSTRPSSTGSPLACSGLM